MTLKKYLIELFAEPPTKLRPDVFRLKEHEKWWRDRFRFLELRGYRLRERLRPGWIPSWELNPKLHPEDCEDSTYNYRPQVTPAVRVQDEADVIIKKVSKRSREKDIAVFLSSEQNESNYCVPILDTFEDETDDKIEFIVMPLLRRFDSPPFHRVNEVIDFMRQTLQGIALMHSRNVAHRDCSDSNIMMDGSTLFPNGFHPIRMDLSRSQTQMAEHFHRSDVKAVKYYFTDFGLSTRFDSSDKHRLVLGCRCLVDVPELSDFIPYDPFAVDIYLLGDVYRRHFMKFTNVQFLKPLVDSMVQVDPNRRPDANKALRTLDGLVASRPGYALRWRLIDCNSTRRSRLATDIGCIGREGILALLRIIRGYASEKKHACDVLNSVN